MEPNPNPKTNPKYSSYIKGRRSVLQLPHEITVYVPLYKMWSNATVVTFCTEIEYVKRNLLVGLDH